MKILSIFVKRFNNIKHLKLKGFWKRKKTPEDSATEESKIDFSAVSLQDFQRMIKYGKPFDTIGQYKSKAFIELPYGVVKKDLPLLQKQGLDQEAIELLLECQFEKVDLSKVSGNEFISFLLWIKEQREFINTIERNNLSSDPEPELSAAGIHRLDEFGSYVTIDSLSSGNILNHAEIEKLPYYKVYEKLKLDKIQREIEKAYGEIIKNKK